MARKTILSRSPVRVLMRDAGANVASGESLDFMVEHLEEYGADLIKAALSHTKHSKRVKLTKKDIEHELKLRKSRP